MNISRNHYCVIPTCSLEFRKISGPLSWHRIPHEKNKDVREKWLAAIRNSRKDVNWQPSSGSRICSRHFENISFKITAVKPTLCREAMPTLHMDTDFLGLNSEVADDKDVEDPPLERPYNLQSAAQIHEIKNIVQMLGYATLAAILLKRNEHRPIINTKKRSGDSITETPKKRGKLISKDHPYCITESPRSRCTRLTEMNIKAKKKLILLKQTVTRKQKKLDTLIPFLKKQRLLNAQQLEFCDSYSSVMEMLIDAKKKRRTVEYSDDMKQFAVTLHFYSPKAYTFLRNHLTLPHPTTLSSWMKSANCEPGLCIEVIDNLRKEKDKDKCNVMQDVVMMIDEMAIRKDTPWDPKRRKYMGYCDYGNGQLEDDSSLASNALVCLVAGLSGGWKCPIGYIFTDKCDGKVLTTFVVSALSMMTESGFIVHSITADGGTSNVAMFSQLGVIEEVKSFGLKVKQDNITPCFVNAQNDRKVYAIYDVVHMMKLWRNCLANLEDLKWKHGPIKWTFIEELNKIQQSEHIVAANKLNNNHIQFEKHKMKVKFATQIFSKSVADAIDFCCEDLGLNQFADSMPTTLFLRLLDQTFDILNSRNPKQTKCQAPMTKTSLSENIIFLEQVVKDILEITYQKKVIRKGVAEYKTELLCKGRRKRAVIGLAISIKSIIAVSKELLLRSYRPFRYVLTYRFSQDLLELFFNKVRSKLGKNDNPNVVEFINIMKRVWHQNLLKSNSSGNCINQDEDTPKGLLKLKCPKRQCINNDHLTTDDNISIPDYFNVETSFYENCLAYIAGNVVHSVAEDIKCGQCFDALFNKSSDSLPAHIANLIIRKNRGGLTFPSYSVYKICKKTDGYFKSLTSNATIIPKLNDLDSKIRNKVLKDALGMNVFPDLGNHVMDFDPVNNESHLIIVIKLIVTHFLKIRLFSHGLRFRREIMGISQRHSLTKATLFRNE